MHIGRESGILLALFLVAIMLVSPVATAASAGMTSSGTTHNHVTQQSLADDTIEVSNDISVWERSVLPLRADTDEADVVVPAHRVFIDTPEEGARDMNRDEIGIFEAGTDVPVELRSVEPGANTEQFANEEVQIVVAHSDGNPMTAAQDLMSLDLVDDVDSLGELLDLLDELEEAEELLETAEEYEEIAEACEDEDEDVDEEDCEEAEDFFDENEDDIEDAEELVEEFSEVQETLNENVEFSLKEGEIDEDGALDFEIEDAESGQYGALVATGELFNVEDGDLFLPRTEPGTIVGVEAIGVHDQRSSVTASDTVEPGENVTFDIETGLDADDSEVTHVVGLYNEDTLLDATTTIEFQEELDSDLTAEDALIKHEIAEINGTADLSEADDERLDELNLSILDDLETERNEGPFDLADVIANLTEGTLLDGVETEATDNVTLDASMTAVTDVGPNGNVTVETDETWTEGEYRFVHMAVDQTDTQSVETDEGSVTVAEDEAAPPPGIPVPPEPPDDPDKLKLIPEVIDDDRQEVIEPGIGPGTSVSIQLDRTIQNPDYVFTEVGFTTVTTTVTDLDISFRHTDDRPGKINQVPTRTGGLTFMQLDYPDEVGESVEDVTVTAEVSKQRLANDDRKAEEVAFYRYDDGEWEELDADIMQETDDTVTYLVDSPGLSIYAPTYKDVVEPGEVNVVGAELSETEIEVGESVDVTATIENPGEESAEATIELRVDGETVDTADVILEPGETNQITFTETFDETGEYDIDVDETQAGTLTVVDEEPVEPDEEEFSFLWYVLVVLAVVLLVVAAAYFYGVGDR